MEHIFAELYLRQSDFRTGELRKHVCSPASNTNRDIVFLQTFSRQSMFLICCLGIIYVNWFEGSSSRPTGLHLLPSSSQQLSACASRYQPVASSLLIPCTFVIGRTAAHCCFAIKK